MNYLNLKHQPLDQVLGDLAAYHTENLGKLTAAVRTPQPRWGDVFNLLRALKGDIEHMEHRCQQLAEIESRDETIVPLENRLATFFVECWTAQAVRDTARFDPWDVGARLGLLDVTIDDPFDDGHEPPPQFKISEEVRAVEKARYTDGWRPWTKQE